MESAAIATIETHFGNVEDPRMVGKTDRPLLNILVITNGSIGRHFQNPP